MSKAGKRARTGGGRGGLIAGGGGVGVLVLVRLFLLPGGNPGDVGNLLGGADQQQLDPGSGAGTLDHCQAAEDANTDVDWRVAATAVSLDQVWAEQLPAQADLEYTEPGLMIFQQTTGSGCGTASAATVPFYCPTDQAAYFDVFFFEQLEQLSGANAALAQEYIVAHEFGHHIQHLEGTLGLSNYHDPGADSSAVKLEVQADCYGGVWAHYADEGPGRPAGADHPGKVG